jgi:hypothetical protein
MLDQGLPPPCRLPAAGLPLTAFEEYMLLDDRPAYPMTIAARFDFTAGGPPATLSAAFAEALRQEPLLAARIVRGKHGRARWMAAEPPSLAAAAFESSGGPAATLAPALPRIDPVRGPLLAARVLTAADGWSIVVAAHHAACDGLGLVGFMERWLLLTAGVEPRRSRPADAERAAGTLAAVSARGRVAGSWREFLRLLPRLAKGLEGVWQFVAHDVAELGQTGGSGPADGGDPGAAWRPAVLAVTLDEATVAALDRRARSAGVMVNDLLLTALVSTLGRQLDEAGDRRRWIRVATPISLRTKADRLLPAANRVSMVFLDRLAAARHDEPRLLRSFKDEMDVIRSHHLGHMFPLSLEAGRWLPGGLAATTRRPRPQATAVLSNLGRCFHRSPLADRDGSLRVGESRLAGWWMVPPIRPGTALAVATHETAGRRTIACQLDASRVPLGLGHDWLVGIRAALEAAGHGPPSARIPRQVAGR